MGQTDAPGALAMLDLVRAAHLTASTLRIAERYPARRPPAWRDRTRGHSRTAPSVPRAVVRRLRPYRGRRRPGGGAVMTSAGILDSTMHHDVRHSFMTVAGVTIH